MPLQIDGEVVRGLGHLALYASYFEEQIRSFDKFVIELRVHLIKAMISSVCFEVPFHASRKACNTFSSSEIITLSLISSEI